MHNEITAEKLIEELKRLFKEEEREHFIQLNMLFNCSKVLSSEFVLIALLEKLEKKMEEGNIDEHLQVDAGETWILMNQMYGIWNSMIEE